MHFLGLIAAAAVALTLGACNILEGSTLGQIETVQKAVAQGEKFSEAAADKMATGFKNYCEYSRKVPNAVGYVRTSVNAALERQGSEWRAGNFCERATPTQ